MPGFSLHQLDQRSVAVEFPYFENTRVVKGQGRIVAHERFGTAALHVMVEGAAEDFEFVFDLERFAGLIEHGERFACDFAIRLGDMSNPFLPDPMYQSHGAPARSAA